MVGMEDEIKKDSELKGRNYSPNIIHSVCLCKHNASFVTVVPRNIKFLKKQYALAYIQIIKPTICTNALF